MHKTDEFFNRRNSSHAKHMFYKHPSSCENLNISDSISERSASVGNFVEDQGQIEQNNNYLNDLVQYYD